MRRPLLLLLALAMLGAPARAGADPAGLEQAWHRCLREAYAHQPPGQSRAGDQRNALDACKEREDAYVAALMASQGRGERGLGARAMGWAASVAASVLDPVTAWLRGLGR
ncbi:hypothetical protein [Methylobacterium dankookense]|uniref:Lysozyme inhibitor LprI N-terminal domain-containing protein n=1 Tax=Methylobacterium dankookense TaxID=560405 RepID=A0A564G6J8_9HYPH|nr:hypothetical protein [Methylobacterium dankookense]GJD55402.1 hypothetical protein IFDJLNFL_1287 [Methylobacterium dankookense]VUF15656.1 hypothetical protein MTDSW087_05400 [Methylobacterium dankookense]